MSSSAKGFSPTVIETLAVIFICFGFFIALSIHAVLAGYPSGKTFDDAYLLRTAVFEIIAGAIALTVIWHRGHQLSELFPSPSWRGSLVGVLLFTAALMSWYVTAPAFSFHRYENQPIAEMAARSHPTIFVVIVVSMINGLYEEMFLLGYLVRGYQAHGTAFALGISLLVRMLYHLYQGPVGVVSVLVFGGVLSLFYWRTKALWPAVLAHAITDIVALAR